MVEAGHRSGDRLIYLKSPMTRGDDVADLQRALGTLGFDAGRVDGIFGPIDDRALRDFQRNAGLTSDGVGGPLVVRALEQLGRPTGRHTTVAGVRERERLRAQPPRLTDCGVVIGEGGGLDVLVRAIDRGLQDSGALVAVLHHPQPSVQAVEANDFRADDNLGLALVDHSPCEAAYYSTPGFVSEGGRQLAQLLIEQIRRVRGLDVVEPRGRWLPILRETRMPSVFCTLGPPDRVVADTDALAATVHQALKQWVSEPIRHEP